MERFRSFIPKRRGGFTLIEVMITLTVLGFILIIIFGAFRLGLSAWEKGESLKEEYQKVRVISQLISQQMKSAVPYKIRTQKAEGDYLAFEGNGHSLKYVSGLSMRAKEPEGFVFVIYDFREEGRERGRLVLYEQRALNRDFFEDRPKEELEISLLEGVSNVRFEYYRQEDKEKNWTEGWGSKWNAKDEKELPRGVRMTITLSADRQAGRNKFGGEKTVSILLLGSIPANRWEGMTTSPSGLRTLQPIPQSQVY